MVRAERCIPGGGRAAPPNALRAPILLSGAAGTPGTACNSFGVLSARCRAASSCAAAAASACCMCSGMSKPTACSLPKSAQKLQTGSRLLVCAACNQPIQAATITSTKGQLGAQGCFAVSHIPILLRIPLSCARDSLR